MFLVRVECVRVFLCAPTPFVVVYSALHVHPIALIWPHSVRFKALLLEYYKISQLRFYRPVITGVIYHEINIDAGKPYTAVAR